MLWMNDSNHLLACTAPYMEKQHSRGGNRQRKMLPGRVRHQDDGLAQESSLRIPPGQQAVAGKTCRTLQIHLEMPRFMPHDPWLPGSHAQLQYPQRGKILIPVPIHLAQTIIIDTGPSGRIHEFVIVAHQAISLSGYPAYSLENMSILAALYFEKIVAGL